MKCVLHERSRNLAGLPKAHTNVTPCSGYQLAGRVTLTGQPAACRSKWGQIHLDHSAPRGPHVPVSAGVRQGPSVPNQTVGSMLKLRRSVPRFVTVHPVHMFLGAGVLATQQHIE